VRLSFLAPKAGECRWSVQSAFLALGLLATACRSAPAPLPPDVAQGQQAFARAEALESRGAWREAAIEYERVARVERSTLGREPARALVRAAALWSEHLSDPARAERDLFYAIRAWPDAAPADDAVRALERLAPAGLRERLLGVAAELGQAEVVDNLRFAAAGLIEHTEPARARAEYEQLARDFPQRGLRDDALWRAAGLARQAGDTRGALEDLRLITSRRRDSFLIGSFESQWVDDAQLLTGRILLEDLHDTARAVAAFELLRDDMKTSTLRDDAQMWIARARAQAGDAGGVCAALALLRRDFPDSRYLRREAPELAQKNGCR
jgi:hypothetical protein